MKLSIPTTLLCISLLITTKCIAQQSVIDGLPLDSLVFTFNTNDTLIKDSTRFRIPPTSQDSLWQIGTTQKTFFSTGGFTNAGIMTDSVNHYPVNANSSFIIQPTGFFAQHLIVSFKHKYQTDSSRDGGIVEFSVDTGKTWRNIIGACTADPTSFQGIRTDSFYSKDDTLITGEPAFTGTSNGWRVSRFQFFHGFPLRTTGTTMSPDCLKANPMIRFRFVSDTTADTLDGWIIDDIQFEADKYWSGIDITNKNGALNIHPNPTTGTVNFPTLPLQGAYRIALYNVLGTKVLDMPYQTKLDVSNYKTGIYFYKVTNGEHQYTGRLMIE